MKKLIKNWAWLFLFVWGSGWAATKYLSPDGSALWAACTTSDTPCAISTAQTSSAAGDINMLTCGTYSTGINTGTNGSAGNLITWQAVTPGCAILNGLASGQTDKVLVVDNAYHRFDGIKINVQTGPGAANTYGLFVTAATYTEFVNGEITYTGDEATTGAGNIIYCAQIRSNTLFDNNYVHNCTYGINVFNTTAGFTATITDNIFKNMIVGDPEDSDCMSVSGAASYDWKGLVFSGNQCSGYRDDGIDLLNGDNIVVTGNTFRAPSTYLDTNENSSCVKVGYEGSDGNVVRQNACYDLNPTGSVRNYGFSMTGPSTALIESNVVIGAYRCADIAQRNGSGGANNVLRNNTCVEGIEDGIRIYSGATGTVLQNNIIEGSPLYYDVEVTTGLSATGTTNHLINGLVGGAGTYTETGDTDGNVDFVTSNTPKIPEDVQLKSNSPLLCAGTFLGRYPDHGGGFAFKQGCVDIGAWATSQRIRTDSSSIRTDTTSIREQ